MVIPPAYGGTVNIFQGIFGGLSNASLWWTDYLSFNPAFNIPISPIPAGAGAFAANIGGLDLTDHPGIMSLTTGTTAVGRVFILSNVLAAYHLGVGGLTRTGTWMETSALLSDAVNRYTLRSGFYSIDLPNTIGFGIGFEYVDNENGGRWQAIAADGVGETSADTGVLVTGTTWYKLEVECNADGDSVDYFIDDVLVANITTDIPAGTGFSNFFNTHIMKLVGTAPRTLYVDASYGFQEVSR